MPNHPTSGCTAADHQAPTAVKPAHASTDAPASGVGAARSTLAAEKLSERQDGNPERQARIARLVIHGRGAQAQRLLEAEVLNEQQRATRYSAEPDFGGEAA